MNERDQGPQTKATPSWVPIVPASPWAFRDLPALYCVWWAMFVVFGVVASAVALGGGPSFLKLAAIGWLATVGGVSAARRGLPAHVCAWLVLGGELVLCGALLLQWATEVS